MADETRTSTPQARWADAVPSREAQAENKRRAVLQEAARAFGQLGFHNASLDDVAERLGVTKPALYRYVKTKHEILFEVKKRLSELGESARAAAIRSSDRPEIQLQAYIVNYIEAVTGELDSYAVMAEPVTSLPPEYRSQILRRMRASDKALRAMIEACISNGSIPRCDTQIAVSFFMGSIVHIARWYSTDGKLSGREIGEMFAGFILNGLRGMSPPLALGQQDPKP